MEKWEQKVWIGGMSESPYGLEPAKRIQRERLGNYTVLFNGPWTPEQVREVGEFCRRKGMRFVMDEMMDRLDGTVTSRYRPMKEKVLEALSPYRDVLDGSLLLCEYGGLMFYWPQSTVDQSPMLAGEVRDFREAERHAVERMRKTIAYAQEEGVPGPFICIEAGGMTAPALFRAGIGRVDLEVTYNSELERNYSALKGACLAFGKEKFGVDMAMVWYGGNQHDFLWERRWRTSLFHAFLRGANPIYAEHGVMDYRALGKEYGADHPQVQRFCAVLRQAAEYAAGHPRPKGLPKAVIGVVQGRLDGFVGMGQTHLWGQREKDEYRIGNAERSWELFERFYRRRSWENRERFGEVDYSGNPPLGQVDVLPYDAPVELLSNYRALLFLGRNSMDDGLYQRLVDYVRQGGQLLMTAAHMDSAVSPQGAFKPYLDGDWSELFGVRMRNGEASKPVYGVKFREEPACGWRFPLWSPNCDPKFTDGGFPAACLERVDGSVLAVASDRFADGSWSEEMQGVLYCKEQGTGCAILLNSLEYPGAEGVKGLYGFLMDACCEANQVYPKVECSDRVRFACYAAPNGQSLWFLNTEEKLSQSVRVWFSRTDQTDFVLEAGEIREVRDFAPTVSGET